MSDFDDKDLDEKLGQVAASPTEEKLPDPTTKVPSLPLSKKIRRVLFWVLFIGSLGLNAFLLQENSNAFQEVRAKNFQIKNQTKDIERLNGENAALVKKIQTQSQELSGMKDGEIKSEDIQQRLLEVRGEQDRLQAENTQLKAELSQIKGGKQAISVKSKIAEKTGTQVIESTLRKSADKIIESAEAQTKLALAQVRKEVAEKSVKIPAKPVVAKVITSKFPEKDLTHDYEQYYKSGEAKACLDKYRAQLTKMCLEKKPGSVALGKELITKDKRLAYVCLNKQQQKTAVFKYNVIDMHEYCRANLK